MEMDELRQTVAANIIRLRAAAGMTQTELGEKLSYSDKSVSKWERAAALPDLLVLRNMAELFGVDVDYFLHEHNEPTPDGMPLKGDFPDYSMIIGVCVASICTVAVLAFVVLWLLGHIVWLILGAAVPVTLIAVLVLNSLWRGGRGTVWIVMGLVLSLLVLLYLIFMSWNIWQLFLVLVPAELVVYLSFHIRRKPSQ